MGKGHEGGAWEQKEVFVRQLKLHNTHLPYDYIILYSMNNVSAKNTELCVRLKPCRDRLTRHIHVPYKRRWYVHI